MLFQKKQFHSIQFRKNRSRYVPTNNQQSRTNHKNYVKSMTSNQDMITVILTTVEILDAPNYRIKLLDRTKPNISCNKWWILTGASPSSAMVDCFDIQDEQYVAEKPVWIVVVNNIFIVLPVSYVRTVPIWISNQLFCTFTLYTPPIPEILDDQNIWVPYNSVHYCTFVSRIYFTGSKIRKNNYHSIYWYNVP